ncbi:MAG: hypothetical protein IJG82_09285 [Atopobiaceae bacterium]|nr:hypothetical protein [Atopobiaceae bacterium]
MSEYVSVQPEQLVAVGQNVLFVDSIPCNKGYVLHRNGSGILTLRGCGTNCFARYEVTFNGNIAVPTGGTAAAIAVALAIDGEPLQSSRAIVTPAAAEQYFNVTSTAIITVPRGCCYTVAVENVAAGVSGPIEQQAISVADGNLTVSRIA